MTSGFGRVGKELSVRTASGDVEVDAVGGPGVVHSTSGDVRVHSAATDIQVRTVSGDVRVGDAVRGVAEIVAVSGDVEIGVHAGTRASVNLNTVSGDTRSDLEINDSPIQRLLARRRDRPGPATRAWTSGSARPPATSACAGRSPPERGRVTGPADARGLTRFAYSRT